MSDRRGLARIAVPMWLLASFATAALAHGCIGLLGVAGIGGDAYATRDHAAVVPVGLAALSLAALLLVRSGLTALHPSQARALVANFERYFGELRPVAASAAVGVGALATLLAMECVEQRSTLGHVAGISEALGGDASIGLAIVAIVAALVTLLGLRCARVLLAGTVAAFGAVFFWIVANRHSQTRGTIVRRTRNRADICAPAFFARCFGMRAPPLPDLV